MKAISTVHELLGSTRITRTFPPSIWIAPDNYATSRYAQFHFECEHHPVAYAQLRALWSCRTPGGVYNPVGTQNIIRLVTLKDGVVTPIAYLNSINFDPNYTLHNDAIVITSILNQLIVQKEYVQIGWQVSGDGQNICEVESLRLEITWNIGVEDEPA